MKKILTSQLLLMFLSIIIFSGCDEKEPVIEEVEPTLSQIIMSPGKLYFNDTDTSKISLSTQPSGSEFTWSVSSKPEWLEIKTLTGEINQGILELEVISNPEGLDIGKHDGTIEIITSGAGKALSEVQLYIDAKPQIKITEQPVTIDETESYKRFTISNEGTGFLNWKLDNTIPWISFDINNGTIAEDRAISVGAYINRDSLTTPGTKSIYVPLVSNAIGGDTAVFFDIIVPEVSRLSRVWPSPWYYDLVFDFTEQKDTVQFVNTGNKAVNWELADVEEYLNININSGSIAVGDTVELVLTIDRSNLTENLTASSFKIKYGEEYGLDIPVKIYDYKESKTLIDGQIIDAEYDRRNDVVIAVTTSPNKLLKYDPSTQTFTSMPLNMYPFCVSVSKDGNYAVVGHDGRFSYVDLGKMTTLFTEHIQFNIDDIIISPDNNWVYTFKGSSSSYNNYASYDLSRDTVIYGSGSYYWGTAKLHPTQDYIYTLGYSYSYWNKLNIAGGAMVRNTYYYNSNYSIGSNMWISDDGEKIFGQSGTIFTSSTDQNSDMKYYGRLQGKDGSYNANLIAFDYNSKNNIAAGILGDSYSSSTIAFYDAEYLTKQNEVRLPGFFEESEANVGRGKVVNSLGQFGFFNEAGTQFYVLLRKNNSSSYYLDEWAITTIDVE
ncbi:hypothetical protein R9C00_22585 [Flammeovirgaceae bacterium SG7u.111]|nr:hypothetical protein [Flammeovirgaceae bacterium SG7u.132]WPO34491.1 hypothetical protein R9C00_22585 [Flammeovirgaceae bacterium SG7u.111]